MILSPSQHKASDFVPLLLARQQLSSDILSINQPDYMAKMKTNRAGRSRELGFIHAAPRHSFLPAVSLIFILNLKKLVKK